MRKQDLAIFVLGFLVAGRALAGSLDPANAPGPTMYTLENIYLAVTGDSNVVNTTSGDVVASEILKDKKAWVKGKEVTGTMPNVGQTNMTPATSAQTIPQGYHDGTGSVAGDANLVAGNIKTNVMLFGVTGTLSTTPAAVPKTGQTTSYVTGDDGYYQKGMAFSIPRFTIQSDTNCILDNMTGLIWARNANLGGGTMTWSAAIIYCEDLTYGGQTDWRLPNQRELSSLVDDGRSNPSLPSGHPFTGVLNATYWSSTTSVALTSYAWYVNMSEGFTLPNVPKTTLYNVWPVRGGQ